MYAGLIPTYHVGSRLESILTLLVTRICALSSLLNDALGGSRRVTQSSHIDGMLSIALVSPFDHGDASVLARPRGIRMIALNMEAFGSLAILGVEGQPARNRRQAHTIAGESATDCEVLPGPVVIR